MIQVTAKPDPVRPQASRETIRARPGMCAAQARRADRRLWETQEERGGRVGNVCIRIDQGEVVRDELGHGLARAVRVALCLEDQPVIEPECEFRVHGTAFGRIDDTPIVRPDP